MRWSSWQGKTSPGPCGPGEVADHRVRILPKPSSQPSRRRIVPVFAAGPRPKHPAGRYLPPTGGFRREPPVPDFAASHLAGSGFLCGFGATFAQTLFAGFRSSGTIPLGDASSPEGAACRALWGYGRSGKSFRLYGLLPAVPAGDSIRRLCTCLTHRHKPPPCALARCLGPILSRVGSRRVSVRPLCAAAPTSRHTIDCPCILAGRLKPAFAILLGRLDSPGMGNGIRGGGASCWGSPLSRLPLTHKLILPARV